MKRANIFICIALMFLFLVSCGDTPSPKASPPNPSHTINDVAVGTRSNPYHFYEDIPITTIYEDDDTTHNVNLVFHFSNVMDNTSAKAKWIQYGLSETEGGFAGSVSVLCDTFDNTMYFSDLVDIDLLTTDMLELVSEVYDTDAFNELGKVYSDTEYPINILYGRGESHFPSVKYITLSFTSLDSNSSGDTIWIAFPTAEEQAAALAEEKAQYESEVDAQNAELYPQFVKLVEDGQYQEANEFRKNNKISFDYKDTADYWKYSEALAYYTDKNNNFLYEALKLLQEDVSTGFLESEKYISEINTLLTPFNGTYKLTKDSSYLNDAVYMSIKDGKVAMELGRSNELPTDVFYNYELARFILAEEEKYIVCTGALMSDEITSGYAFVTYDDTSIAAIAHQPENNPLTLTEFSGVYEKISDDTLPAR